MSIWTPYTSDAETLSLWLQNASLATSIFPERDRACYIRIHSPSESEEESLCKRSHDRKHKKELSHLITLKNFISGGHEVAEGKIIVCVKSIGGERTSESACK